MQTEKQLLHKRTIIIVLPLFMISYLFFLTSWLYVKDSYAQGVTYVASKVVAGIKGARFEGMEYRKDEIELTFSLLRQSRMLIDIPVKTSSYTFNAPLTFAIIVAMCPFIKRRVRALSEALMILIGVHLLYVGSLEAKLLTDILVDRGLETKGMLSALFYEFLWTFTDNMVIRFEPFLIGFYLFVRFRMSR